MLTPGNKFRFKIATQQQLPGVDSTEVQDQILPMGMYVLRKIVVLHRNERFEVWKAMGRKVRRSKMGRSYAPTRYILVQIAPTIADDFQAEVLASVVPGNYWKVYMSRYITACNELAKGGKLEEVLRYI